MDSWDSLTIAEQTLMRRAVAGYPLGGMIQNYGLALRWAGAATAPAPRRSALGAALCGIQSCLLGEAPLGVLPADRQLLHG
ncbi:hypothetical protein EDD99_0198 [Streptomyces sp. 846.5]|nr:hypothetical protein EDD99_0198 [Streptomyces sp. 846.5]